MPLSLLGQMRCYLHTPESNTHVFYLNQEPEVFSFLWLSEDYSDHPHCIPGGHIAVYVDDEVSFAVAVSGTVWSTKQRALAPLD